MNATCPNCNATFHHCERSEDGQPEIPDLKKCADPDCETLLCPVCQEHFSFVCSGCDKRFCQAHAMFILSGDKFCFECYLQVVDEETGCTLGEIDWPILPVLRPITREVAQLTAPEFRKGA